MDPLAPPSERSTSSSKVTTRQYSSSHRLASVQPAGEDPAESMERHFEFDTAINNGSKGPLSPYSNKPPSQRSFVSQASPGSASASGSSEDNDDVEIANAISALGLSSPSTFRRKSKAAEIAVQEQRSSSRRLGSASARTSSSKTAPSPPTSPAGGASVTGSVRQKRHSKSFAFEHSNGGGEDSASVASRRRTRARSVTRERSTSPGRRSRSKSRDAATSSSSSSMRRHRSSSRDLSTTSPGRRQRPSLSKDSLSVGAPSPRRQRSTVGRTTSSSTRNSSRSLVVDNTPVSSASTSHSRQSVVNTSSSSNNNNNNGSQRSSRTLNSSFRAPAEQRPSRIRSKAALQETGVTSPDQQSKRPSVRRHRSLSTDAESRRRSRSKSQDRSSAAISNKQPAKSKSVGSAGPSPIVRSPGQVRRSRLARRTVSGTNLPTNTASSPATTTTTATTVPSSLSSHSRGLPGPPIHHHSHHHHSSHHHHHTSSHHSTNGDPPPPPTSDEDIDEDDEQEYGDSKNRQHQYHANPRGIVEEDDEVSMADTIQSGLTHITREPRRHLHTRSKSFSGVEHATLQSHFDDDATMVSTTSRDDHTASGGKEGSQRQMRRASDTSPQIRPKFRGRRPRPDPAAASKESRKSISLPITSPTEGLTSPTKSMSSPRKQSQRSPSTRSSPSSNAGSPKPSPSLDELFAASSSAAPDFGEFSPASTTNKADLFFASSPDFAIGNFDDEPAKVDKPPSLEDLFAMTIDENDDEDETNHTYEDSTTQEEAKPQKKASLKDLFASQSPRKFNRATASLSDLFASHPNIALESLPDASICSSPAASNTANRVLSKAARSSDGKATRGGTAATAARGLGNHFLRMNRSWGNFAELDSSVASGSDVASLGSRDLSSGGTPSQLRRGLKKSRSFGDMSDFALGGHLPNTGPHGPRRGKKPGSMHNIPNFDDSHMTFDTSVSGENNANHVAPPVIVGMPAAVAQATTTAKEGSVHVIRTTHTGRTTMASPDDDVHLTADDTSRSGSYYEDDPEQEQEYLQLCLPSSTNTMTTASMTESSFSPLPDRQSPTVDAAAAGGGIFQRFANRAPGAGTPNTAARKTLLPPFRGPRAMMRQERLDDEGG